MNERARERMRQHVIDVAAEHGVTLHWVTHWHKAVSFPDAEQPSAFVPEIRRPYDYLIGLHEIGHCAAPHGWVLEDDADPYSNLLVEGAAWAWAATTALPSLSRHLRAADWNTVAYAFRTYLKEAALTPEQAA